ncbi:hypothetical protein Hanom_Chr04g00327481 [Helianthus anomalus]
MRYVSALRESLDEMTLLKEVIIDNLNYLSMGLEDCLREINLLHQRLNILSMPPIELTWTQEDWNLANEVIQPTWWEDEIPEPPPLNVAFDILINPARPHEEVEEEPYIFLPREIEEMLNYFKLSTPGKSSSPQTSNLLRSRNVALGLLKNDLDEAFLKIRSIYLS